MQLLQSTWHSSTWIAVPWSANLHSTLASTLHSVWWSATSILNPKWPGVLEWRTPWSEHSKALSLRVPKTRDDATVGWFNQITPRSSTKSPTVVRTSRSRSSWALSFEPYLSKPWSLTLVPYLCFLDHPHMTSAVGGLEGVSQKADVVREVAWIL